MKEAEAIKQNVISCLKRKQLTKAQLFIDASYRYPTSSDWKILLSELPELFDKYDGHFLSTTINDIWQLSVTDINHADQVFDTRFTSYTIVISSKYHANESQNLISKLDDAMANLRKHAITDEDDLNWVRLFYDDHDQTVYGTF